MRNMNLLSGEVHYWRLNPDCWEKIIDSVKDLGLNIISTYVPWEYHELKKGQLDFEGKTTRQRDLVGFIKLLQKKKMWLIIRPGPYLYTEWKNKGIPSYMVKYHRNHPEFKRISSKYIRQICKTIRPFLVTNGGNIIMVQADNEIDIWSKFYEDDMGFLKKSGIFQEFLKKKYKNIEALNSVWRTNYKSFSEAKPVTQNIMDDFYYRKRYIDFCEFRHYYGIEFAKWVVKQYRDCKINVPIYLNAYPWVDVQHYKEFADIADVFGVDIYPVKEFRGFPDEQRRTMNTIRYIRTFSNFSYIAEFESGVWHGAHYHIGIPTPNHYRLICFSMLQAGVMGWNWYMLVNRDNWYMCPINEWGRKRLDLFGVFKNIVDIYKEMEPSKCQKLTEVSATFEILQSPLEFAKTDDPVLGALYQADIEYEFFDLDTGSIKKPILFYANKQFLPSSCQKRLVEYVESGGTLVLFQEFPRMDENFKPLNKLGILEPEGILEEHPVEVCIDNKKCKTVSSLFMYNKVPGKEISAKIFVSPELIYEEDIAFENLVIGKEYTIGYIQKVKKGAIVVLGIKPSPEVVKLVLEYFNIPVYSNSQTPGITSSIFKKDKKYFLIVTNNSDESKHARIILDRNLFSGKPWNVKDLVTGEESKLKSMDEIVVYVPQKDGKVLEII